MTSRGNQSKHARTGVRALIRDYIAAHGPQKMRQLAEALHIDPHTISGALHHGCEANVFVRLNVEHGTRYDLVAQVESSQPAEKHGSGSGNITPLPFLKQKMREDLARLELERAAVAGPRKPGRGRPSTALRKAGRFA